MSRFYVPKESVKGDRITISGKEAHHILDVMRLKFSDEVVVFDGTGKEYVGRVTKTGRRLLSLQVIRTRDTARKEKYSVTLIQAIPKKEKMDYIVEKATELGVANIIPVTTERTIPDWNDSKRQAIVERWRRISLEAAKQCGRVDLPRIAPIMAIEQALKDTGKCELRLMAALNDKAVKLKDALKEECSRHLNVGCAPMGMVIAIGPEGDFTPDELKNAQANGFKTVNLGPRVLKSDTAGLAALAMINYEYQD